MSKANGEYSRRADEMSARVNRLFNQLCLVGSPEPYDSLVQNTALCIPTLRREAFLADRGELHMLLFEEVYAALDVVLRKVEEEQGL